MSPSAACCHSVSSFASTAVVAAQPKNLELWIWFLIAFVVGIPACAQLNCWIEKKRDECDRKSRDDAH